MSIIKNGSAALALFTIISLLSVKSVNAHPGNTDSSGCHTCRTNCANWGLSTGEYHCHRAKAVPQPKPPVTSTYGENGTGYTSPAPEYEKPKESTDKGVPVTNTTEESQKPVEPQPEENKETTSEQQKQKETEPVDEEKNSNQERNRSALVTKPVKNEGDGDALAGFLTLAAIGGGIWYWKNKKATSIKDNPQG